MNISPDTPQNETTNPTEPPALEGSSNPSASTSLTKITTLSAIGALVFFVPIQTIGTSFGMIIAPETYGQALFAVAKFLMLIFPIVWLIAIDKQRPRIPRWSNTGMGMACILGTIIFIAIWLGYLLLGDRLIDPSLIQDHVSKSFLGTKLGFLAGALYWCTINSLLEEYWWRWWVFTRCEVLMPKLVAVVVSGFLFTVHHIIALSVFFDWPLVILCSLGVFIGGTSWSWLYLKYRNIYAAYICHVFPDIIIFAIGYHMIFNL